ncbi:hypothetical protein CD928_05505 [Sphingopyxis sp. GW247-27LB]|nr:hypothetical protein CD928_05505 [Sphingopyxis sp. GW247-27LB]
MPLFIGKDFKARETDISQPLMAAGPVGGNQGGDYIVQPAYAVALRGREGGATAELGDEVAFTLRTGGGGGDKPHVLASVEPLIIRCGCGAQFRGEISDICSECGTIRDAQVTYPVSRGGAPEVIPFDTTQITSKYNYSHPKAGDPCHPLAASAHPPAVCVTEPVTHTLTSEGFDASEDGTGRGNPIVCHGSQDPVTSDNLALPVQRNNGLENDILEPPSKAVRRLMPPECERLQGFPDGYTRIPVRHYKRKKITKTRPEDYWEPDPKDGWWLMTADSVRYKQLGNSMPVPVMFWIGQRITRNVLQHSLDGIIG